MTLSVEPGGVDELLMKCAESAVLFVGHWRAKVECGCADCVWAHSISLSFRGSESALRRVLRRVELAAKFSTACSWFYDGHDLFFGVGALVGSCEQGHEAAMRKLSHWGFHDVQSLGALEL